MSQQHCYLLLEAVHPLLVSWDHLLILVLLPWILRTMMVTDAVIITRAETETVVTETTEDPVADGKMTEVPGENHDGAEMTGKMMFPTDFRTWHLMLRCLSLTCQIYKNLTILEMVSVFPTFQLSRTQV